MSNKSLLQNFTRTFRGYGLELGHDQSVIPTVTEPVALDEIYKVLPKKFPKLFEELLLNYRWYEAEISSTVRILPNPPGDGLTDFLSAITKDKTIFEVCSANGFLQFARGKDQSYDPICFDLQQRTKSNDYSIVRLDHEEILCRDRIHVSEIVAPSFKDLVLQTVLPSYHP